MPKISRNMRGFDIQRMDKSIRPQDDFYRYANGKFLKNAKIPSSEARWGSFTILRHKTDKQLNVILNDLLKGKKYKKGSYEQIVRDLYASGIDIKTRNKRGLTPLLPWLEKIELIKTQDDLIARIGDLQRIGVNVPWGMVVDQDSKNSSRYALHFFQSGLGMPEREYYLKNEPEYKRVRKAYEDHIEAVLKLLKKTPSEIERIKRSIMQTETLLAKVSMNKVDARDAEKTYHKKTLKEFKNLAPNIDWKLFFKASHVPEVPYVIVAQPEFMKGANGLLSSISLDDWKIYLTWHLVNESLPLLSRKCTEIFFNFYIKTLTGAPKMRPLWKMVLSLINSSIGEALGKIYVKKHFGPDAKRAMDRLVDDLFTAYGKRIKNLDWMSESTKSKALKKLWLMKRKIGYPKRFKSYRGLVISPTDYLGNVERIVVYEHDRQMRKLKQPVDRNEWHMAPQVVNAYCNFNLNEIVFPAAILQSPFFDIETDEAINYGAIGSVIGHEITHGFDDQGSKFDGYGNMKSWWTDEDRSRFDKRSKLLVEQYGNYKVADGVPVNGKLTLGENIADLGGLAIAYDAYKQYLSRTKKIQKIQGFTPEERFFLGAARAECELWRDEYIKTAVLTDPHSPSEFRINGPLPNIDAFYGIYGVQEGDKLYRKPTKRVRIW